MKKDKIKVKTTYKVELKDTLNQIIKETIKLEVNDHGKKFILEEKTDRKLIFPQEFLTLLKLNKNFEFLSWFERNKLKLLTKAKKDNIVLLRKR